MAQRDNPVKVIGLQKAFARAASGLGLAVATLVSPFVTIPAHADKLILTTAAQQPLTSPEQDGFLDLLAQDVFRRTGHEVYINHLPPERALRNANDGIDDGDLHRIGGLSVTYTNLIQVPEPTLDMQFLAYAKGSNVAVKDWQGLESLSVGYIRGWKIVEIKLAKTSSLIEVEDSQALFLLLKRGRSDAVIYDDWQGLHQLRMLGIADVRPQSPPLSVNRMYIYLHKRHHKLVPRAAAAIQQAKTDGTFDRLYQRVLAPLAVAR